jgi:hypothetical protein
MTHSVRGVGCGTRRAVVDLRCAQGIQTSAGYDHCGAYQGTLRNAFATQTCFVSLNQALQRLHRNKNELLRVLQFPELPKKSSNLLEILIKNKS